MICKILHQLPDEGGVFQQKKGDVKRLLSCLEWMNKKELDDIKADQKSNKA